eukprot:GEMP01017526.1.p1 GENE.GEMP01017526.1~~GEMP01017526.1.p1  ORF type:complete len:283 (+),score=58.69 GEMP01017526.1:150-998(+)
MSPNQDLTSCKMNEVTFGGRLMAVRPPRISGLLHLHLLVLRTCKQRRNHTAYAMSLNWYGQRPEDQPRDPSVLNADFASLVGMSTALSSSSLPEDVPKSRSTAPASSSKKVVPSQETMPSNAAEHPVKDSEARNSKASAEVKVRDLSTHEKQAVIEHALQAKENLVSMALEHKKKRALQESKRLLSIDARMKRIDQEEQIRIDNLRVEVEQQHRLLTKVEDEMKKKKDAMERATKEYVEVAEKHSTLLVKKKDQEDQLIKMMVECGERKNEELNKLLEEIGE